MSAGVATYIMVHAYVQRCPGPTDVFCSSMVPGILPSQLEILSMGQTYFEPCPGQWSYVLRTFIMLDVAAW